MPTNQEHPADPLWTEIVEGLAAGLRFGSVSLAIHEGRVIQIEVSEKTRLAADKLDRLPPPLRHRLPSFRKNASASALKSNPQPHSSHARI